MVNEDWERKLKAIQESFEDQEKLRAETQANADKVMAQMGAKLNVFRDPFLDRASETEDLMSKIRGLNSGADTDDNPSTSDGAGLSPSSKNRVSGAGRPSGSGVSGSGYSPDPFGSDGASRRRDGQDASIGLSLGGRKDHLDDLKRINDDIKAKADKFNDLQKRKDDLEARRLKRQGMDELSSGLKKACGEYDRMADDLEQQVADMDDITQRVNQAIEDRAEALDAQIGVDGELSNLKMKKRDQDRELINLDKEID